MLIETLLSLTMFFKIQLPIMYIVTSLARFAAPVFFRGKNAVKTKDNGIEKKQTTSHTLLFPSPLQEVIQSTRHEKDPRFNDPRFNDPKFLTRGHSSVTKKSIKNLCFGSSPICQVLGHVLGSAARLRDDVFLLVRPGDMLV